MTGQTKVPETRRLYQQTADQIRLLIQSGQFPPGSRLPAERDLAQQLGVSRPSLREALIALEIDGSIEIRMGSGIYVNAEEREEQSSQNKQTRSLGDSPTELMQARAMLEGAVIIQAAAAMTAQTLAQLRQTLDEMRAEISAGRKPLEQDRLFHLRIAAQVGNSVIVRMVEELFDARHSPIAERLRARFEDRDAWRTALEEHEAILVALEARNPLAAHAAMHTHLLASSQRWV